MQLQSMPDTSPTKWHLAHTTWFFETFLCQPFIPNYTPFDPSFNYLFNPYYNGIGAQYPRPKRGLISRPSVDEVMGYRDYVDTAIAPLLDNPEHKPLIDIGINHEQQHQELMLTDIKHALFQNPTYPTYTPTTTPCPVTELNWLDIAGGLTDIGHTGDGFAYDNEQSRHSVHIAHSK